MKYVLLYTPWVTVWATSSWYYTAKSVCLNYVASSGITDTEAAVYMSEQLALPLQTSRLAIYLSVFIFALLAYAVKERPLPYRIQLQHMLFIIGAKVMEHVGATLTVLGCASNLSPYTYDSASYLLALLYIIVTPIRIIYLGRKLR
ncbi:MAG: hypothetical protein H6550_16335 [Chitinophagales bacterium]|nr:hypothetical protein [Chitinophagales bacterium]